MTIWTFTVIGSGEFPIDMLRYDQCWPMSESEDSRAIRGFSREMRSVTLRGLCAPTEGRWESFGWRVQSSQSERMR